MKQFLGVVVFVLLSGSCGAADAPGLPQASSNAIAANGPLVLPTPEQALWQDREIGMFYHFDIPIYTDDNRANSMHWPEYPLVDPNLFNPQRLDTDQWMEAAQAIGAKYTVYVAKHCSGFIAWQSDAYPYGVKQSKWRDSKGDILREYVQSCRKAGIGPGLYVSWPANAFWQVNNGKVNWGKGGDPVKLAAYAKVYERLVTEAWSNYGAFDEVWFDGGIPTEQEGGADVEPLLRKLQPQAITFHGPTSSIRWVGNEAGIAGYDCWATVHTREATGNGDPNGTIWMSAECDVPVRGNAWFWKPNSEHTLRSLDNLMNIYYCSVGRNCNLLINANIDRDGRVPALDMQRYHEFGAEIKRRFGTSLAETSGEGDKVTLKLSKPTVIDHVIAMEDIRQGERVRDFVIEGLTDGSWQELCKAKCLGHKRIAQFSPVQVSEVRLRVTESIAPPIIKKLAVYDVAGAR